MKTALALLLLVASMAAPGVPSAVDGYATTNTSINLSGDISGSVNLGNSVNTINATVTGVGMAALRRQTYKSYVTGPASLSTTLTNLSFGGTNCSITFTNTGTFWIMGVIRYRSTNAIITANQSLNDQIYRTNNGAGAIDLSAQGSQLLPTFALGTSQQLPAEIFSLIYTTVSTNDVLLIQGSYSAISSGNVQAISASLIAVQMN